MNLFKKSVLKNKVNVRFHCADHLIDVIPSPMPSSKCFPEYFKKLPLGKAQSPQSNTGKRCIPLKESMNQGFIIPIWSDMYVKVDKKDLIIEFPFNLPMPTSLEYHDYEQLKGYPLAETLDHGKTLMKFMNPWIISTSPGVSCLFTSPLNHFENRFKLIDGVVDTDTYYNYVNLPFVWTGEPGEYFIKKGTPLVQVIPFIRDNNLSNMSVSKIDEERKRKVDSKMGTLIRDKYKSLFWHKRKENDT